MSGQKNYLKGHQLDMHLSCPYFEPWHIQLPVQTQMEPILDKFTSYSSHYSLMLMMFICLLLSQLNDTVFPFGEAKDQEHNEKNLKTKVGFMVQAHGALFIPALSGFFKLIVSLVHVFISTVQEIQQSFNICLSSLRILAKFLGYLVFDPYQGGTSQSKQATEPVIRMRNKVCLSIGCYQNRKHIKG